MTTQTSTDASAAADDPVRGIDIDNGLRRIGLLLRPIDTLFFRDGKPFGASSVVASGLPQPQTFAGAIATSLIGHFKPDGLSRDPDKGCAETRQRILERLEVPAALASVRCRGPWLARRVKGAVEVLVPTPADLMHNPKEKDSAVRRLSPADPSEFPDWPKDSPLPLWWDGSDDEELKPIGGFLRAEGLKLYLAGGAPRREEICRGEELFALESKVGIAIDPQTLSAAESMIYAIRLLRLKPGVCLYAEIEIDAAADADARKWLAETTTLPFGGEAKRVAVSVCSPFDWAQLTPPPNGLHVRLLTAPAFFGGTTPNQPPGTFQDGAALVSAAVPGQVAFSGWDLARRCPKPTRYFAPAGSVFYFERGDSADTWADDADAPLGYGTTLRGAWPNLTKPGADPLSTTAEGNNE